MPSYLSKQDVLASLLLLSTHSSSSDMSAYYYILIALSCSLATFYITRYTRITKKLPCSSNSDIRFCLGSLVVLTGWNLLFTLFNQHIIFDLPTITRFLEGILDTNLVNKRRSSSLNWFYFVKDMEIALIMVVSMLFIHLFSIGILHCVELFESIIVDIQLAQEACFGKNEGGILTFSYKDDDVIDMEVNMNRGQLLNSGSSSSIRTQRISLLPELYPRRFFKRNFAIFLIALVASAKFLPSSFQLTSSSILFETQLYQFRFDHIYVALVVTFTLDTVTKFIKVISISGSSPYNSFKFTNLLTRFIWLYDCIILNFSLLFIIIFNDVLINMINLIINQNPSSDSSLPHSASGRTSIQFISSIMINYFSHSGLSSESPMCSEAVSHSYCDRHKLLISFIAAFDSLYNILISCWNVLNLCCFIVAPFMIWIIIEIKIELLARHIKRTSCLV